MTVSEVQHNDRSRRFQILSLDGGGIKGIFSAAVLAAIEEDLDTRITDHFDLIAGTSTGGIIALALGYGLRPKEIVEFYATYGPRIFPRQLGLGWLKALFVRKYSQRPLARALRDTFSDVALSACTKRLVIPAFSLDEDDVCVFRTAHHQKLKRDHRVPIWKIALATSAAPSFLPPCREVDGGRHIDGGVWANNPAMVALVEATGTLGVPIADIRMFSIGTSEAVPRRWRALSWAGQLAWAKSGAAVGVLMQGQSIGASNQVRFLIGESNFLRLNPKVAEGEFSLDSAARVEQLIAKARHHSRVIAPKYEAMFAGHVAPPFNSLRTGTDG